LALTHLAPPSRLAVSLTAYGPPRGAVEAPVRFSDNPLNPLLAHRSEMEMQ